MSDLTEALVDKVVLETEAIIYDTAPSVVQPYLDVVAAARRVAEAPEVWWCEEHRAEQVTIDPNGTMDCWKRHTNFLPAWGEYTPCRMVRKLLVDPDNL